MKVRYVVLLTILAMLVLGNCAFSAAMSVQILEIQDDITMLIDGGLITFETMDFIIEDLDNLWDILGASSGSNS